MCSPLALRRLLVPGGALILAGMLWLPAIAMSSDSAAASDAQARSGGKSAAGDSLVVNAYYFHRTFRCETCLGMEKLIHDLLVSRFANELQSGKLRWQALNYEEEANGPLYAGYGLSGGPAFALSRRAGGREIEWRELGKLWETPDQPDSLRPYLTREITYAMRPVAAEDGAARAASDSITSAPDSLSESHGHR